MKRRDFIQKTAASSALLGLGGLSLCSFKTVDTKHLTILHTNDVHSYIDPFPTTHPKNPNMGGVARRAALIEAIRKENSNVLLLDAGDIFQGTPYFNYYGGELEFKLMSMMKYDLAASFFGHHVGDECLFDALGQAKIYSINDKQEPDLPGRGDKGKTNIDQRIYRPARYYQSLSPEFVRQVASDQRADDLAYVQRHPEQRQHNGRDSGLTGTQQQESIGGI